MMFRNDILTVKREIFDVINGEVIKRGEEIIVDDVPCHLSVNLTSVQKNNETPYLMSDFILFASGVIDIKPNDILFIVTSKGQKYELFAGEIKFYGLTTQVVCRQEKIIRD